MGRTAPAGAKEEDTAPSLSTLARFFRVVAQRSALSANDEVSLCALFSENRRIPAGRVLVRKGEPIEHSLLLLDGLLCRYADLGSGTRQITTLHLPGDFADLQSFTLSQADQDILALAESRVAVAPHRRISRLVGDNARLGCLLWQLSNIDGAIQREWELSLGQRDAAERMAHLLCELHARLGLAGLSDEHGFTLPMTQIDLSQCLALSVVHTSRVLRQLREQDLVRFTRGRVLIPDIARLQQFAGFDPAYLHLGNPGLAAPAGPSRKGVAPHR